MPINYDLQSSDIAKNLFQKNLIQLSFDDKFTKAFYAFFVQFAMTKQQRQLAESEFTKYDIGNDGFISKDGLYTSLKSIDFDNIDHVVDNTFDKLNCSSPGKISYSEFLCLWYC